MENIFSKNSFQISNLGFRTEARERNHVDGNLAEIAIELTGEAKAASGSGEGGGDEMVQITVSRGGQLQST